MLAERVHAFIESDGSSEHFERLALEVFARQYAEVPMYRRLCQSRDVSPANCEDWRSIPYLPTDAFKYELADRPDTRHIFYSSGTTAGAARRSRHALGSLDTYRLSATCHFRRCVLADEPGPMAILVLGPTAGSHPQSSLGQMFSWCVEDAGTETSDCAADVLVAFDCDGRVDLDAAVRWLGERARDSRPVMILAVTSALSLLLDALRERATPLRLPADSRVVDTGGKKGGVPGQRILSARGLLKACWRFLHVPAYLCVNEYGMTEMLSQFYDDTLCARHAGLLTPRAKVGPAWVRTTIVDPATLMPVVAGETGILRHFDLANWDSVSALQTLDLGRTLGNGFEVLGRASSAQRRGCSQLLASVATAAADDGSTRSGSGAK